MTALRDENYAQGRSASRITHHAALVTVVLHFRSVPEADLSSRYRVFLSIVSRL